MAQVRNETAQLEIKKNLEFGEAKDIDKSVEDYATFEVVVSSVHQDAKSLANTASGERDKKRKTLIDRYIGHVENYIDKGLEFANPVLVYMIIWLIDLGRIGDALKFGVIAVNQKQMPPQQWRRNLPTFIADSVCDWAQSEFDNDRSVEPYFTDAFKLLDQWPVPDAVVLKFTKLAGDIEFKNENYEGALKLFLEARGLEKGTLKAKVKGRIDKTEQLISKATKEINAETQES
jgi:hypothetical protein